MSTTPATGSERVVRVRTCPRTQDDIDLCYTTFGDPTKPCLLLVCGLSVHLGVYDPHYMQQLADIGFYVVLFDNRDAGRSTKLDHHGKNSMVLNIFPSWMLFGFNQPIYTLDDLADDAWALLDHLKIRNAYLFGTSMGGMIAQCMAIRQPERTLGLISVMSSTGSPYSASAPFHIKLKLLTAPASEEADDVVAYRVRFAQDVLLPPAGAGASHPQPLLDYVKRRAREQFDRVFYRLAVSRQTTAISRAPDRERDLAEKLAHVPTLVIHGTQDRLVPFENGCRTARCFERCTFLPLEGEGHYLTPAFYDHMLRAISDYIRSPPTRRADHPLLADV